MPGQQRDIFQADICAERLKALGDPLRLRIVDLLRHGQMSVGGIADVLETQVTNVSHHLQILKHAQLVSAERNGRFIYYQLHEDVMQTTAESSPVLDLGCCRIEVGRPS
jgi:DNA-binding transcriptional ArsR family regulator